MIARLIRKLHERKIHKLFAQLERQTRASTKLTPAYTKRETARLRKCNARVEHWGAGA